MTPSWCCNCSSCRNTRSTCVSASLSHKSWSCAANCSSWWRKCWVCSQITSCCSRNFSCWCRICKLCLINACLMSGFAWSCAMPASGGIEDSGGGGRINNRGTISTPGPHCGNQASILWPPSSPCQLPQCCGGKGGGLQASIRGPGCKPSYGAGPGARPQGSMKWPWCLPKPLPTSGGATNSMPRQLPSHQPGPSAPPSRPMPRPKC
mmetsp:Transcript_113729/g.361412  ORF Transcript_113729/g.361412 Transcript_113729/m.361412 type:complete len:207 (-) Transcript_113729:440-1060(-)